MTGLLPISPNTGKNTSESSNNSAQHHGTSEMNGSRKAVNETHRAMKSRHLTMIGMYPSYTSSGTVKTFFRPAIGGTIGTGIFLSAGIVRRSSSLSYCCIKVDIYRIRPYRQAVLQVHFSLIVFLAYSFTVL